MINLKSELSKIVTAFNAVGTEVEQKFEKLYSEEIADGRTPEQATEKALRRTQLAYRRENLGKVAKLQGLILGVGAEYDNSAGMRKLALENFSENPARALAEGYVNEKGEPLDNNPFLGDGKTRNFRFKRPLAANDFSRKVIGLLCVLSDDRNSVVTPALKTTMWCRNEACAHPPIPFHTYNTTGVIKNQSKDGMIINSKKATGFQLLQPIPSRQEVYTTLKSSEALKGAFMQTEHLSDWMQGKATKLIKSSVVFIEGDVLTCDPEINEAGGSWSLVLDNGTENGLRCFVPKHIPVNCAEDDKVVVVANVRPATEKYAPSLSVMGLLLHPDYTLPIEVPKLPKEQEATNKERAGITTQPLATDEAEKRASALNKVKFLLSHAKEIDYLTLVQESAKQGLMSDEVERAVRSMMMEGLCYEPKVGKLKWAEVTPGTKY